MSVFTDEERELYDRHLRELIIESRGEQQDLFGNATLPEICQSVRMGANSSTENWDPTLIRETVSMLRKRLKCWQASVDRHRSYDDAVRALVWATIQEVEAERWWQQ